MKKLIATLFGIALFHSANCQNVGLRASTIFSGNREINNAFGGGLYFGAEDSSEKFGYILFGDYQNKNDLFNDCTDCPTKEISTFYQNISFGLSGLWIKNNHSKTKIKFGPLINYSITNANRQGQIANWIETFKTKSIGTGLLFNIHFQQVLKLPLNFDIFISPVYLINIKNDSDPTGIKSGYSANWTILNLQLGLSYKIK